MSPSIYLINPANDFPTYFGAEVFDGWGLTPATGVADPSITTVAAMPIVTLGSLVAPAATDLHRRLREEGRLVENGEEVAAMPWSTNIIPKLLTREELFAGARWLAAELYAPQAFGARMLRFLELQGRRLDLDRALAQGHGPLRPVDEELGLLVQRVAALGTDEATMVGAVTAAAAQRPEFLPIVLACLRIYAQIRHMYGENVELQSAG